MKPRHAYLALSVAASLLGSSLTCITGDRACANLISPDLTPWVAPLPIPPVALPQNNPAYPGADYYVITETQHKHRFHPELGQATVRTYGDAANGGVYLGPTIIAHTGRKVVVKYVNNLPTNDFPLPGAIDPTIPGGDLPTGRAAPHLHGGFTASQFDGTPDQWWTKDGIKGMDYFSDTFIYTNQQRAALLWYHDHAMGITRHNPYLGLAAAYLIVDNVDTSVSINGQKTPTGPYHIPLVLQDKAFNCDGSLFYPTEGGTTVHPVWVPEFFGDTPVINGAAYPYLDAQPRQYRFRLINGSQARFYNLKFAYGKVNLPFWVIGSDGGLLPEPAKKTNLLIAPGERFDLIADFSKLSLKSTVILTNDAPAPYPGGDPENAPVDRLMQIRVNTAVPKHEPDDSHPAQALKLPAIVRLKPTPNLPPRDIVLKENSDPLTGDPTEVLLNGRHFMDPVADFIKAGSTEVWQFINLTVDAHPMHLHLVQFQALNRQAIDVDGYTTAWQAYLDSGRKPALKPNVAKFLIGPAIAPASEELGPKDTLKCYPGQVTRMIAKFDLPSTSVLDPISGTYGNWVYHCHILEHEENDMMQPFTVVP